MARDGSHWMGRRRKRRLGAGTRLKVIVTGVRPAEGMVDLELGGEP